MRLLQFDDDVPPWLIADVHRFVDILAVDACTPLTDLAEQMLTGGHSRIPVYQGDLDHNGQEDLLVEATMQSADPDKPSPSVILRVSDNVALLAPEGMEHNGTIEVVGSWDTGAGAAVVLLQTFWAGGSGTHLLGFNDDEPTLLGQWACGT